MRNEIPYIGEVRRARDIPYRKGGIQLVWTPCIECSKPRWVAKSIVDRNNQGRCHDCANKHLWVKGIHTFVEGKKQNKEGYIFVKLQKESVFYPMANKMGWIAEHRLVVATYLGRCLKSWEVVHHKHTRYPGGSKNDKSDNRYENLELTTIPIHHLITLLENKMAFIEGQNIKLNNRISELENRITLLEAEIVLEDSR
jgi:hypothetical protein